MKEKLKKIDKQKLTTISLIVICALFVIGLTSYAAFSINLTGTSNIVSKSAKVSLTYIEPEEVLISDEFGLSILEGKTQENYFEFTVSSTSEVAMNVPYNIYITEEETNTLDREKIYVYITEVVDGEEIEVLHPQKLIYFSDYYKYENSYIITNDNFRFTSNTEQTKSRTYRLRMWVDASTDATTNEDDSQSIDIKGGTYEYKVHVDTNVAPENCFVYTIDETTNEATITGYNCSRWNTSGYDKITDLIIPTKLNEANVVSITASAFKWKGLESVVLPNKLETLHGFIFNNLSKITIGGNVTSIGNTAFHNNSLTEIVISDRVVSMGYSFTHNQMPDETAYIYARTDENGDGIAEIDYTKVASYAGANKEPVIPEGIVATTYGAFSYCGLTSVTFPSTFKTIGEATFICNELTNVELSTNLEDIHSSAFSHNQLEYIIIPENSKLTTIYYAPFSSSNRVLDGCVDNPNLTTIYNNSGKSFDFQYAVNGTKGTPFITGTVPSYTYSDGDIYNEVTVTTGYPS